MKKKNQLLSIKNNVQQKIIFTDLNLDIFLPDLFCIFYFLIFSNK